MHIDDPASALRRDPYVPRDCARRLIQPFLPVQVRAGIAFIGRQIEHLRDPFSQRSALKKRILSLHVFGIRDHHGIDGVLIENLGFLTLDLNGCGGAIERHHLQSDQCRGDHTCQHDGHDHPFPSHQDPDRPPKVKPVFSRPAFLLSKAGLRGLINIDHTRSPAG